MRKSRQYLIPDENLAKVRKLRSDAAAVQPRQAGGMFGTKDRTPPPPPTLDDLLSPAEIRRRAAADAYLIARPGGPLHTAEGAPIP